MYIKRRYLTLTFKLYFVIQGAQLIRRNAFHNKMRIRESYILSIACVTAEYKPLLMIERFYDTHTRVCIYIWMSGLQTFCRTYVNVSYRCAHQSSSAICYYLVE